MSKTSHKPVIAIACGGTGGHLFPGLAVAETLADRGCAVMVLISPKEVDQQAIKSAHDLRVEVLPAVALSKGKMDDFLRGFWKSFGTARQLFRQTRPQAVLAMGGFTSAPPVLAGKLSRALTFLHESNTIPGRANRWLSHVVDRAFVGFNQTGPRLHHQHVIPTGTPVRAEFQPADSAASRLALGFHPDKPVLLIQGGSQGARGVNRLVTEALPAILAEMPALQFLHLTGLEEAAEIKSIYQKFTAKSMVLPFLTEMDLAMNAATLAISRAGASSLAELAALQLPAILVPYPFAMDNHQYWNARAYVDTGAAWLLEEKSATAQTLADTVVQGLKNEPGRDAMKKALARWHAPHAAELIADKILALLPTLEGGSSNQKSPVLPESSHLPRVPWNRGEKIELKSLAHWP